MSAAASPQEPTTSASPAAAAAGGDDDTIEAAAPDEAEDAGEFEPSEFDASSTTSGSVTSSVFHHSYENGRRYHQFRNGRYPIPNDDVEQNREDMKHALHMELTDGKLFFAPIGTNPQKIIDLGTGTGVWAIEVADQYPSAEVLGIDLSPIQPHWVPPNLRFLLDDFEDEWVNGSDFDLAHLRWTTPMIKDVPRLLQRIFANLKPGGWVELQEFGSQILSDDDTLGDAALPKFWEKMAVAMESFGMTSFYVANELGPLLEAAGFNDVTLKTIKVPMGTWPKEKILRLCGLYMKMNTGDFMAAMAAKPLLAIMSKEEAQVFAAHARRDLENTAIHSYMNYRFWTGQKPL